MKVKGSRRLVARLGLALAVAAFAVPSASAMTMNAMNESGGGGGLRLYADDLHAPLAVATLNASNVRTDAASLQPILRGSNVRTDAASFEPTPVPVSSLASDIRTDAASSVPITDARHSALLKHRAQVGQQPTQLASTQLSSTDSTGINWGVAAIGAALGAFGLMLLFAVLVFAGRNNRRGRLAAT